MIRVYLDRDVEKPHGLNVCVYFWPRRGVNFSVQWRSWEHPDPWMLTFNVFVFGTFLWARPNGWGYWARRCCSNGINLFHWEAISPKE